MCRVWARDFETRACRDDHVRAAFAFERGQKREALRRDFRVGQNIFDGCKFGFGQKLRVRMPVEQSFVKQFLRANARAKDPYRFIELAGEDGDEKSLRRLDDVRKGDWALAGLDLTQFLGDRLGRFDHAEELIPQQFFHGKASAEKLATSKPPRLA